MSKGIKKEKEILEWTATIVENSALQAGALESHGNTGSYLKMEARPGPFNF
jgi:hypothetical protein